MCISIWTNTSSLQAHTKFCLSPCLKSMCISICPKTPSPQILHDNFCPKAYSMGQRRSKDFKRKCLWAVPLYKRRIGASIRLQWCCGQAILTMVLKVLFRHRGCSYDRGSTYVIYKIFPDYNILKMIWRFTLSKEPHPLNIWCSNCKKAAQQSQSCS